MSTQRSIGGRIGFLGFMLAGALLCSTAAQAQNAPPVISGTPPTTAKPNLMYQFQPSASDANGDTQRFNASGLPSWAKLDNKTGRVSGTPSPRHLGRERRALLVWGYLALALAVLIKGPVALGLAGLVWGLWPLLDRRQSLTFWLHPAALTLMALIMLPWFILVTMKFPEFPGFFLWEHHVRRSGAGTIHPNPFCYYGPVLLGLMMPWSWLLPWTLARLKPNATPERLFLLVWAGIVVLFFSISGGKLVPYILPALLPLSLIVGEALAPRPAQSSA